MNLFSRKKDTKDKSSRDLIEQILLDCYNQYYRLAYSYAHNAQDASDIVQNGAFKALKGCHTLKHPEYAQTWVYRIMLNECFQHARQPKLLSYESYQEETGAEAGCREDHYANVDLQRAIEALPDKDRAIIILKYIEDKKLEEIADLLDENLSTVKSRLYRCIKKLRTALSDNPQQDAQAPGAEKEPDRYPFSRKNRQVMI